MPEENADGLTGEGFDLETFRAKVLSEIKILALLVETREVERAMRDGRDGSAGVTLKLFKFIVREVLRFDPVEGLKKVKNIDSVSTSARMFLESPETRRSLCPALRRVEGNLSRLAVRSVETDAAEIASTITPLLAFNASDRPSIPRDPTLHAVCAWMIARTGVTIYCLGERTQS